METYSCITSSSSSSNHIRNLQSSYNRAAEAEQSMNYLQNTNHERLLHVAAAMNSSSTGGDSTRNINDEIGSSSHEHKKEVLETEDINGEDGDYYEEEEEEKKKKKTKAGAEMKKVRRPRFAFQTRSQVDILDDGYRWRKYGQKAVKNNNFPRSYYRCTHQGCNVKKQVQRLSKDEEVVVTTYEGTHTHPIQTNTDNFEQILKQMHIYTTF